MTGTAVERRWPSVLVAVAPAILATVAACLVAWLRGHRSELAAAVVWGLVMLVSFVGWGGAAVAKLWPARRLDWGLLSAIGMAVVLALGGLLQVARLGSTGPIVALAFAGLAAHATERLRRRQELIPALVQRLNRLRATPLATTTIVALYAVVLFAFLGNFATPVSNVWDDLEAYFVFPKSMLAFGALEEPFSFRRLGALGGQSLLQSMLLAGSSVWRLNGFDNGVCLLSIFGMVHGSARGRRGALIVPMFFLAFFVYRLHNVASALSGTVFFLAMFRVLDAEWPDDRAEHGLGLAILLGLLGAAACTLRQNYIAAVAGFLGASYGLRLVDHASDRRGVARAGARTLGFLMLFLLPWWIVALRSSATFLFPVIMGNGRSDFGMLTRVPAATELQFLLFNAFWNKPVRSIAFFVIAGLCLDERKPNRSLYALIVGAGVGTLAIVHGFQASDDVDSVSRYYMAFELACVLAVMLKCLDRVEADSRPRPRTFISAALVVLAIGIQLWDTRDDVAHRFHDWGNRVTAQLGSQRPPPDPKDALYARLQATIPAGAPFIEILDEPFRLDFRRNRIFVCDQPGGASPRPGLPVFAGVARYEQYFRDRSLRYLAYTLGDQSPEYNFTNWQKQLQNHDPPTRNGHSRGTLLREMAPIYLDVYRVLDELSRRHKVLFASGQIRVIDLGSPPDGLPPKT